MTMPSDLATDGGAAPSPTAMGETDESDASLATVFDLLSDETRLRIVSALAAYEHAHPEEPAIRFAALRERVNARDSGRFNYHLRKLDGILVEKGEDGYSLTPVGRKIIAAVSDIPIDPLPA